MEPSLNFPSVVGILGMAQGVFLCIFLLTQARANRVPTYLLTFLVLCVTFLVFLHTIYLTKHLHILNLFVGMRIPNGLLIGPALYLYVKALTVRGYRLGWQEAVHAIPFLISLAYFSPLWLGPEEGRISYATLLYDGQFPELMRESRFVRLAHRSAYSFGAVVLLYRHRAYVLANHSNLEGVSLKWLGLLVVGLFLNLPVAAVLAELGYLSTISISSTVIYPGIIYMMAYMYLRHPDMHYEPVAIIPKYSKSGLTGERAQELKESVERLFEQEQVYKDPELTASGLAKQLSISTHNLSYLMNEVFRQTFFDFVNTYRVEEAKKLLLSETGSMYTVLAIALEVGFKSKSTFNAVFKKYSGMTPTDYRSTQQAV